MTGNSLSKTEYDKTSVLENVSLNMLMTLLRYAFSAVTIMYVSRILGPSVYGRVAFTSTFVGYFSMAANLGLSVYGVRQCASVRNHPEKLRKTFTELYSISIALAVLSLAFLFAITAFVPRLRTDRTLILLLAGSILANSLGCEWLFRGLEQYRFLMGTLIFSRLFSIIGIFLLVKTEEHYLRYAALLLFSTAAADILRFFRLRSLTCTSGSTPGEAADILRRGKEILREHLPHMFTFFLMSCAVAIYSSLDLVMLGFMKTDADVGLYNLVYRIKTLLVTFSGVLWMTILPRASASWNTGRKDRFEKYISDSISAVYAVQIPATLFVLLFAEEILLFCGGSDYLPASASFRITALSILPIGLSNVLGGQTLIPAGREHLLLKAELCGAALNFGLNLIFIPAYGIIGAALTTVAAETAVWLLCHYCDRKYLGIHAGDMTIRWKNWIAAIASALCAFPLTRIPSLQEHPFLRLFAGAGIFTIVYCALSLLMREENICLLLKKTAFSGFSAD